MVINPSIEIYLLDRAGRILSYSADPGQVKRQRVSLEPIRRFLTEDDRYPVLGDDPRNHSRRKAFSVMSVPQGYLYVILRGEQFDSLESMIREGHVLRLSALTLAASLGFALLLGLVLFRILTRRLYRLTALVSAFHDSDFTLPARYEPATSNAKGDEFDALGRAFEQMARRLGAQLAELERTDASRRELVANVSHDLRTPLASLHGYLETLQMKDSDLLPSERAAYLATALRHSDRLRRLVEELFELATLDAHEVEPNYESFSLPELVQDAVQKFALEAQEHEVSLSVQSAGEAMFVRADIGLIERVLQNFLGNALDHTPPGGQVEVRLRREGAEIVLAVADTGRGIQAQDLSHIFERFYRADDLHRGGVHAGLGLAIARRIVELHGSVIAVASEVGAGTTFEFGLPAVRAAKGSAI